MKVTAIVSVYNAEIFLKACLEDLVAQSIFDQTEVIIIDAHSPQNEKEIAEEFTQKHKNIKYIRTAERESLYASWNRAIKIAKGEYITNANADDRHATHAFERLAKELDVNPHIALTYANCRVTTEKNALFHSAPIIGVNRWLAYDRINLLRRCEMGPQPMWRRSVHDTVGFFDDSYTVTGDYDMWLRMAEHFEFRHIPEELGLYLTYDNNLETQNPEHTLKEHVRAQQRALQYFIQDEHAHTQNYAEQLKEHEHRLTRYISNLENGNSIRNRNKLAYHIFAYILLSVKLGAKQMDMLEFAQKISNMPSNIDADYLRNFLKK